MSATKRMARRDEPTDEAEVTIMFRGILYRARGMVTEARFEHGNKTFTLVLTRAEVSTETVAQLPSTVHPATGGPGL